MVSVSPPRCTYKERILIFIIAIRRFLFLPAMLAVKWNKWRNPYEPRVEVLPVVKTAQAFLNVAERSLILTDKDVTR